MVDRPSKRQGPGPACGEVEDGVLAWHGGFDRPSVRTRTADDRAGRSLRPSAGEKVTGPWARHPRPAPPPSQAKPSRPPWPARLKVFCAPVHAIPGVNGLIMDGPVESGVRAEQRGAGLRPSLG